MRAGSRRPGQARTGLGHTRRIFGTPTGFTGCHLVLLKQSGGSDGTRPWRRKMGLASGRRAFPHPGPAVGGSTPRGEKWEHCPNSPTRAGIRLLAYLAGPRLHPRSRPLESPSIGAFREPHRSRDPRRRGRRSAPARVRIRARDRRVGGAGRSHPSHRGTRDSIALGILLLRPEKLGGRRWRLSRLSGPACSFSFPSGSFLLRTADRGLPTYSARTSPCPAHRVFPRFGWASGLAIAATAWPALALPLLL
jgi:hypothetical protein